MIKNGLNWYSSFDGNTQITHYQSVATALSGSSALSHASLFLEYWVMGRQFPEMTNFDLYARNMGDAVTIREQTCQTIQNGDIELTTLPKMLWNNQPKVGTGGIQNTHHHSYTIDTDQTTRLLLAIQRFKGKAQTGRYKYFKPGGALGVVCFPKPGHRAVNCADFLIKILNEAGIADIGYRLWDTPVRVAN